MENRIKLLGFCGKIVGVICLLFVVVDLIDGAFVGAMTLALFAAALLLPIFWGMQRIDESVLCLYFCIGLNLLICVVTLLEQDYIASVPLFICAGTISAIFFDTRLVKLSFSASILFYLAEMAILLSLIHISICRCLSGRGG